MEGTMKLVRRCTVVVAAVAAGVLYAGCGGEDSCSLSPEVRQAPTACVLAPSSRVTVNVGWCSCTATTTCEVRFGPAGVIELEPKVNSCDATCEDNAGSCPMDSVPCTFDMPDSGYEHIYVYGGLDFRSIDLTISGSNTTCS
jgi:hypothetical protein